MLHNQVIHAFFFERVVFVSLFRQLTLHNRVQQLGIHFPRKRKSIVIRPAEMYIYYSVLNTSVNMTKEKRKSS